ncbi:hypothetical protein GCK32_022715, partial [Trichostrongylus colubriformis]
DSPFDSGTDSAGSEAFDPDSPTALSEEIRINFSTNSTVLEDPKLEQV